jgi:hypothetical protein
MLPLTQMVKEKVASITASATFGHLA